MSIDQEKDFFREIPGTPENYTAANVLVRMIDGLGYRYYWATEGLSEEDMSYQVSADARNVRQTLEHLHGLSVMIKSTMQSEVFEGNTGAQEMSHAQLRKQTLANFQTARSVLVNKEDISSLEIDFGHNSTLPLWNAINGPIEDAVWHAGQVVMMRRAAGNPLPAGVNVLMGKTKE